MNLRLALTAVCLFGIGLFSKAQTSKPKVENGPDAIPVTVKSTPRKKTTSTEVTKFTAPVIVKDGDKKAPPPPPPPPPKRAVTKELPAPPPPPKQAVKKDLPAPPPPPPLEARKATAPKKELPPPPPPPKAPKQKD